VVGRDEEEEDWELKGWEEEVSIDEVGAPLRRERVEVDAIYLSGMSERYRLEERARGSNTIHLSLFPISLPIYSYHHVSSSF